MSTWVYGLRGCVGTYISSMRRASSSGQTTERGTSDVASSGGLSTSTSGSSSSALVLPGGLVAVGEPTGPVMGLGVATLMAVVLVKALSETCVFPTASKPLNVFLKIWARSIPLTC